MNDIPSSNSTEESRKFPVRALLVAVVILAAAAAVLVFNVPVGSVLLFGFLGWMMFGHFFLSVGHGVSPSHQNNEHNHDDPNSSSISMYNHADGPAQENNSKANSEKEQDSSKDHSHSGHSGCC